MRHRVNGLTGVHDQHEGEIHLQKPHGSTTLDLGGAAAFEVIEHDEGYEIRFEANDRSEGSISIGYGAFE